jgi:DNA-binding XRE family transcriptional regulator
MKFNGKKLKAMRIKKKLSQEEFAQTLNQQGLTKITRASVNQWEHEASQPSGPSLHAICKVFGATTSDFYGK